jgi:hypothetical protein
MSRLSGLENPRHGMDLPFRAPAKAQWIAGGVSAVLVADLLWAIYANFPGTWTDYGWALFVLAPAMWGFLIPIILGWKAERLVSDSMRFTAYGVLMASAAAILVQREGFICVLMALPIAWGISAIGALVGYAFQTMRWDWKYRHGLNATVLVLLPFAMIQDRVNPPMPMTRVVTTSVVVKATPEEVWPFLYEMKNLPAPDFWLFRAGVAYPIGVTTTGRSRHCLLSTGDMPEEITASEPGKLLRFKIIKTPPSMKEMNPFGEIHPEHLEGYYQCEQGEFRLEKLPDGTRITGTSWYHHRFAPDWYWSMWTDTIVRQVQLRVMNEVGRRASNHLN